MIVMNNPDDDNRMSENGSERNSPSGRGDFPAVDPMTKGEFHWIHKSEINVDPTYQRNNISKEKVRKIAAEFDYRLFGVLLLSKRPDLSKWAYDGQHRTLASNLRDDVQYLPCMVFESSGIVDEAKAFLGANSNKVAVAAMDKYKASLVARDELALAMKDLIDSSPYRLSLGGGQKFGFSAIHTLRRLMMSDAELAREVFMALAHLDESGQAISSTVLQGVFVCAKRLRAKTNILKGEHLAKLKEAGIDGIDVAIRKEGWRSGLRGSDVEAKGVLNVLNHRKRKKLTFPV